jgi:hypothetical protein
MEKAYVYNIKTQKAVLIVEGEDWQLDSYLDELPDKYADLDKFSVTYYPEHLKGIQKNAVRVVLN